jgi:hypothetical protein
LLLILRASSHHGVSHEDGSFILHDPVVQPCDNGGRLPELEKEKGGSGLRYSFDIKSGKITYEVGIDARSGEVLENSKEGAHPD